MLDHHLDEHDLESNHKIGSDCDSTRSAATSPPPAGRCGACGERKLVDELVLVVATGNRDHLSNRVNTTGVAIVCRPCLARAIEAGT